MHEGYSYFPGSSCRSTAQRAPGLATILAAECFRRRQVFSFGVSRPLPAGWRSTVANGEVSVAYGGHIIERMTPEEIGRRLVALLGEPEDAQVSSSGGGPRHERATVDVPTHNWATALRTARDDTELACDFFDWLSAVDEGEDRYAVVAHVWSTSARHGLLIRTRVPAGLPVVPSVVEIYPGAAWHERETREMFGITFTDHPGGDVPLLLPPEFEGHPLRKEFVLASRVAKPWPGAKEPGESHAGGGRRQPMRPPGVPADWPKE